MSVLLIEDNDADADLVREYLEAGGAQTELTHVRRLSEAQQTLADGRFDCILVDLGLPDSQGLETLRLVYAMTPSTAIVVLTGRDDEETGILSLQEGAQDYLVKGNVNAWVVGRALRYAVERKKLDLSRSSFIARAAHELRTPLAVLAGLGETLGDRFDDLSREQIETTLNALSRQGRRARTLINNLLDLSQLEMGALHVDLKPIDVQLAVKAALEAAGSPNGKNVEVLIEADQTALVDPPRLEQLLVNLLTNAYKYGGQNIRIRTTKDDRDILIAVEDDGPGIPPEVEARLFEPFSRGADTASNEGSGLGLAIARGLAERCGGEVHYERIQPTGARFVVRLRAEELNA